MSAAWTVETRQARYVVGRVHRGQRLQETLLSLSQEHSIRAAWISAIGAFEWIELTEYDQATREYVEAHRFERCELLSMQGNFSERNGEPFWHLHATVSLREDGRDVTYGGHVVDGSVFALELRVECFDEMTLRRARDEATGLDLWAPTEQPAAAPASAPATGPSWAMAADASARAEPATTGPAPKPAKGDWLDHAKFGLCKIEGLSGDGVCIIKLPNATRKKIRLDAMQVLTPREDEGRQIFPVRRKVK